MQRSVPLGVRHTATTGLRPPPVPARRRYARGHTAARRLPPGIGSPGRPADGSAPRAAHVLYGNGSVLCSRVWFPYTELLRIIRITFDDLRRSHEMMFWLLVTGRLMRNTQTFE
jgi:hypothetical protein